MLWKDSSGSDNIEDRRGIGGKLLGGGIGAGVIGLIIYLLTGNSSALLDQVNNPARDGGTFTQEQRASQAEDSAFVSVVLKETEDVWHQIFNQMGATYEEPRLVMFNQYVQSDCGGASSSSGPFYCPLDRRVYIDLSFYNELKDRFKAPGNFAMAYVIAHEVGHHVQNLLGKSEKIQQMRKRLNDVEYNRLSVKMELQADFYAGVWAHYTEKMKGIIEKGDIDEALTAANAIGDDRLQKEAQGYIVPDAFTHGTSAQRVYWFKKGYETGDIKQGDTFSDPSL
ncbi:MAG: zinc metallopeptidase [Taibaiella sp.]|nr:zinc metallopeptidase [Taibaiella sp.]